MRAKQNIIVNQLGDDDEGTYEVVIDTWIAVGIDSFEEFEVEHGFQNGTVDRLRLTLSPQLAESLFYELAYYARFEDPEEED